MFKIININNDDLKHQNLLHIRGSKDILSIFFFKIENPIFLFIYKCFFFFFLLGRNHD